MKTYKKEYSKIKKDLFRINSDISTLITKAKSFQESTDKFFIDREKLCINLRKRLGEDIIRIAVVGPIKSGKSTFLNALFNGDYLKRGLVWINFTKVAMETVTINTNFHFAHPVLSLNC